MALPSAPWVDQLHQWNTGIPDDGAEHERVLTVRADDFSGAIHLAGLAPGVLAALRDFPNLEQRPSADLGVLLTRVHRLVVVLSSLEEHIIRVWYERPEDRGSYRVIAQYLGITHGAVRDRYQRIVAAAARGMSAVGAADDDVADV